MTNRHSCLVAKALVGLLAVAAFCGLGAARAADTFDELARSAEFTFAVMSDNHGCSPFSVGRPGVTYQVYMDRMDQWIKETGNRCIVGVGDHTYTYYRADPFVPFMGSDSFWYERFYPAIGNHDNKCYSNSESTWCGGSGIFDDSGLRVRPMVSFREGGCDYYARITHGAWTIHLIHVNYAFDNADPLISFRQESRDYLVNTLNSIARGPRDIVIATAHVGTQANGHWVSVLSPAEQQVVMEKCDLAFAGHTHRHQRYIHPNYGATGGCLCLNSCCITGANPNDSFFECFVFDNPARVVVALQRIDDCSSPQLRTDSYNSAYSSYVKKVGQVANSVDWMDSNDDWDAFPAGAQSPQGTFAPGWTLVGLPLDPASSDPASVLAGLLGGSNRLENNLMRYEPGVGYQLYPADFTTVSAGRGYWLRLEEPGTASFVGTSRPDTTYVPLGEGWSLVSAPRTWPVRLASCLVRKGTDSPVTWFNAIQLGWVSDTLYYYDNGTYRTVRTSGGDDTYLRPWKAYWIRTTRSDLSLVVPRGTEPTPIVKIADVQAGSITKTTATVSWSSLIFSTSRVDFGPTSAYGDTTGTDANLTRTHSMTLNGLPPGTTLHYKAISTAAGYDPGTSADAVFATQSSATQPADAGFESGGLSDWVVWPAGSAMMQVGSYSAVGKIYPHSGSMFAYTKWATVDQNGGLYARVAAVPGQTYEASVWSNIFMAASPPIPTGDCRSRVGIDPTGGRDPAAATVVWSAWDERVNAAPQEWRRLSVQAQATSSIVTIFLEFYQKAQAGYYQMVNAFDDAAVVGL